MNLVPPPSSGGSSVIRRIQKGKFEMSGSSITIPLQGFTNFDKMIVIANGESVNRKSNMASSVYVDSFTINSLTLRTNAGSDTSNCYYQVIEFY